MLSEVIYVGVRWPVRLRLTAYLASTWHAACGVWSCCVQHSIVIVIENMDKKHTFRPKAVPVIWDSYSIFESSKFFQSQWLCSVITCTASAVKTRSRVDSIAYISLQCPAQPRFTRIYIPPEVFRWGSPSKKSEKKAMWYTTFCFFVVHIALMTF